MGSQVLGERDGNGTYMSHSVRSDGEGVIGGLLMTSSATPGTQNHQFPHYDAQGNLNGITNGGPYATASGGPYLSRTYDAYGNVTGQGEGGGQGVPARKWGYSTKEEVAPGLLHYGERMYRPDIGRWISRDPIGEAGGMNLYGFVGNDPVNFGDPDGMSRWRFVPGLGRLMGPLERVTARQADVFWNAVGNCFSRGGAGGGRPGGVAVERFGGHFLKSVDPNASRFWQWYGRRTLDQQASAFTKLGGRAPWHRYQGGVLATRDVGQFTGSRWQQFKIYSDVSWRLKTPFNDAWHARNIGANGQVFDPTLPPGSQWVGVIGTGSVAGLGGGALYYNHQANRGSR